MKSIDLIVEAFIEAFYEAKWKEIEGKLSKTLNSIARDFADDLSKMYDSYIEQYYEWCPSYYIRHGASVPSSGGTNLYLANNITYTKGYRPTVRIFIDSGFMKSENYKHDDASTVLGNVMFGIRGVPGYWVTDWSGSYSGKYFSWNGTIYDAFLTAISEFDEKAKIEFNKRAPDARNLIFG